MTRKGAGFQGEGIVRGKARGRDGHHMIEQERGGGLTRGRGKFWQVQWGRMIYWVRRICVWRAFDISMRSLDLGSPWRTARQVTQSVLGWLAK